MTTVGVLTTSRADYGIYKPVLMAINESDALELTMFVSGSHLQESHGKTVSEIETDGWPIAARFPCLTTDEPVAIAQSMATCLAEMAKALDKERPDILLTLGDRFEMFAGAAATVPLNIPLAHLHGGETSEGAIDEVFRHGLTKMSHLHFCATEKAGQRIRAMGEESWRITVSGAPGLDAIRERSTITEAAFEERFGFSIQPGTILVGWHPVTRETDAGLGATKNLLQALADSGRPLLITGANADTGGDAINREIQLFCEDDPQRNAVTHLGSQAYFHALERVDALVGNSSSGIIEAASFERPVLNIGQRQSGRGTGENVVHCGTDSEALKAGLEQVLCPTFRASLTGMRNPYGDGHAAKRIVKVLEQLPPVRKLLQKRFIDV